MIRGDVLRHEAIAFRRSLHHRDVKRLTFVAHFQWFDALSKLNTEDIPPTNLAEVEALLAEYFPGGFVEW